MIYDENTNLTLQNIFWKFFINFIFYLIITIQNTGLFLSIKRFQNLFLN